MYFRKCFYSNHCFLEIRNFIQIVLRKKYFIRIVFFMKFYSDCISDSIYSMREKCDFIQSVYRDNDILLKSIFWRSEVLFRSHFEKK